MAAESDHTTFKTREPLRKVNSLKKKLDLFDLDVYPFYPLLIEIHLQHMSLVPKLKQWWVTCLMQKFDELDQSKVRLEKIDLPPDTDIAITDRFSMQQRGYGSVQRPQQKKRKKVATILREKAFYDNVIHTTEEWITEAEKLKTLYEGVEGRVKGLGWIVCVMYHREGIPFNEETLKDAFPDGIPADDELSDLEDELDEEDCWNDDDDDEMNSEEEDEEPKRKVEAGAAGDHKIELNLKGRACNRCSRTDKKSTLMRCTCARILDILCEGDFEEDTDWESVHEDDDVNPATTKDSNGLSKMLEKNKEPSVQVQGSEDQDCRFIHMDCQTDFDDDEFEDVDPSMNLVQVYEKYY